MSCRVLLSSEALKWEHVHFPPVVNLWYWKLYNPFAAPQISFYEIFLQAIFYWLWKHDGGIYAHRAWLESTRAAVTAGLFAGALDTSCKTQLLNQILSTSKRLQISDSSSACWHWNLDTPQGLGGVQISKPLLISTNYERPRCLRKHFRLVPKKALKSFQQRALKCFWVRGCMFSTTR